MAKIDNILLNISKDLATNTEATKNIERHLVILNGKVATQEGVTSTLKSAVDLQSATLKRLVDNESEQKDDRRKLKWLTIENIYKVAVTIGIAYILFLTKLS